mmetsp:Transcript_6425/g.26059  ORF Transcript_6425/g.26059 Transcript_6425/m.26059 type:complete len:210 (-) Transcript_6425:912-1541(-)
MKTRLERRSSDDSRAREDEQVLRNPHQRPETASDDDELDLVLLEHGVQNPLELVRGQTLHRDAHRVLHLQRAVLVRVAARYALGQLPHQLLGDVLAHSPVRLRTEHQRRDRLRGSQRDVREVPGVPHDQLSEVLTQTAVHHLLPQVLRVAEELHVELGELLAHLFLSPQKRPLQGEQTAQHRRRVDGPEDEFQRDPVGEVAGDEPEHRQ